MQEKEKKKQDRVRNTTMNTQDKQASHTALPKQGHSKNERNEKTAD
jgi:hypothetical protein